MSAEELLPCPFCGETANALQSGRVESYGDWIAGCDNEQCMTQPEVLAATKIKAIAAWNRRTPPAMSADHIGEAQGWRNIATAPRDGTMLLVGYDEGVAREGAMEDRQRVFEARWNDVQGTWSARNGFLLHSDATHWQPLPHPPSAHPAPIKPSGDTGELRERVALEIRNWDFDISRIEGCLELADAILDLIQSEMAG